jgi:hypothetical protein
VCCLGLDEDGGGGKVWWKGLVEKFRCCMCISIEINRREIP